MTTTTTTLICHGCSKTLGTVAAKDGDRVYTRTCRDDNCGVRTRFEVTSKTTEVDHAIVKSMTKTTITTFYMGAMKWTTAELLGGSITLSLLGTKTFIPRNWSYDGRLDLDGGVRETWRRGKRVA